MEAWSPRGEGAGKGSASAGEDGTAVGGAVADASVEEAGAREDDCRCEAACELAKKLRMSPFRGGMVMILS